jgi:pimeloyl-ACP methyl ester carboxylesterase
MKIKSINKIISLIILLSCFASCHNLFDDDDEPVSEYLVSYEMLTSYTPTTIEYVFDNFFSGYPELMNIKDKFKSGFEVYTISYNTFFQGKSKVASGLVCIPMGEGPFPILSYQNGTNTLHSNAPSVSPNSDLYLMLEFISSAGFVISLPDYLGFGSSDNMFHPYLHKESTVQCVIDMLRAVKELAEIRSVQLKDDLYITGYSQGGWATLQVQKAIETDYSDEFRLKASAPCAGPYDLSYINDYIRELTEYPMPYFLGYICHSYSNLEGIDIPMNELFKEPYDSRIPNLYDGSKSGEDINAELTTVISDLLTQNYIQNFETDEVFSPLRSALETNSISAWSTSIPTKIIHGTSDTFVPFEVSQNLYDDFAANGSDDKVELIPLTGLDHTAGIVPAGILSVLWFIELNNN